MNDEIRYFLFEEDKHRNFIDSLLCSMAVSHNIELEDSCWFNWKYFGNPYGDSIIVCAEKDNQIIGCVAYGCHPFEYDGVLKTFAFAFENFVHPDFRRRGIFQVLISKVEEIAKIRGIELLIVFPNKMSLSSYIKQGWSQLDILEYRIKILNYGMSVKNLVSFRMPFITDVPFKKGYDFDGYVNGTSSNGNGLKGLITKDFLNWRFNTLPRGKYKVLDMPYLFAIVRIGRRGKLREAQVLFFQNRVDINRSLKYLQKELYKDKFDFISFPISKHNIIRNCLRRNLYMNVPTSANMCIKKLNKLDIFELNKMTLWGINFHTY